MLTLRNSLPFKGGRNRILLIALGNSVYSLTYPRDVTTMSDLGELKCNAAAMFESCMDLTVLESPNGSSTICTCDAVANAACPGAVVEAIFC